MSKSPQYQPRLYRDSMGGSRWKTFRAVYLETDLWVALSPGLYTSRTESFVGSKMRQYRDILDNHIALNPEFLTSLVPLAELPGVHPLISSMYNASEMAGTGPMSAVAGAVAECICNDLIADGREGEVIIENGGDIFMKLEQQAVISVLAGDSPLTGKIGLVVRPEQTPLSVCCSSATVGHSLSFGTADACAVTCKSGALADAYATACCNAVKDAGMLQEVADRFLSMPGVLSVVIIKDDMAGLGGKLEISFL